MSNIIDYAQGLNAYSFDKVFFKDLDVLALTEVAYLPFEQIITEGKITLEKLAQHYTKKGKFYRLSLHLELICLEF